MVRMKMRVRSVYNKSSCGKQPLWYHTSMRLVLHWFSSPWDRSGEVGITVLRCAKTNSEDVFVLVTALWLCCDGNASELKATIHKEWAKIPQERCQKLMSSYASRLQQVIKAKRCSSKFDRCLSWSKNCSEWHSVLNLEKQLVILVVVRYCNYSCLICAL